MAPYTYRGLVTGGRSVDVTFEASPAEYERRVEARKKLKLPVPERMFSNVGRHHPDYGTTPAEHEARKAVVARSGVKRRPSVFDKFVGRGDR